MTTLPSYLVALQGLVGGTVHEKTRYAHACLSVKVGPFIFEQYAGKDARYVSASQLDPADKRPFELLDFRRADLDDTVKVTAPALAAAMGRAIARWAHDSDPRAARPDMVAQALAVAPPAIAAGIRAELAVIRAAILARHAAELAALDAIDKETP